MPQQPPDALSLFMSTTATGRLVDENGQLWEGLQVVVRDVSPIIESDLAKATTGPDGRFSLSYPADPFVTDPSIGPRQLSVRVLDLVHRVLVVKDQPDPAADVLALGDIVLRAADGKGLPVTLGTGVPNFLSQGNAIRLLIDDLEAWSHLADSLKHAATSIELMQLEFDIPRFKPTIEDESPILVFQFGDPPLTAAAPRKVGLQDDRPERIMYDRAKNAGVTTRILLNRAILDVHALGAAGTILPGVGFVLGLLADIVYEVFGIRTSTGDVKGYFNQAGATTVSVQPFVTSELAPVHAKVAFIDNQEAFSTSSPFVQGYFDSPAHAIDDPRRGVTKLWPIHDVSLSVKGPAVADAFETFRLHWNTAVPSDSVSPIPAPPAQTTGGDAICSLQVIRTLNKGRFTTPAEGEKGVLEAYLRAIAAAQQFIYFENQYFTDNAIYKALLEALRDSNRPTLQVILALNIDVDIPMYSIWQRANIEEIRKQLPPGRKRAFGVFTRWTHEGPTADRPRPRICPNYIHAKVGIVDDQWATVGSANLDGASLEYTEPLHAVHFGNLRNSELNFILFNGVAGQPASEAVGLLRRRLWAEHLGFETAPGVPDPTNPALATPPAPGQPDGSGGWLQLWTEKATEKFDGLKSDPAQVKVGKMLLYPTGTNAVKDPKAYLKALTQDTSGGTKPNFDWLTKIDVLDKIRSFSFKSGKWA